MANNLFKFRSNYKLAEDDNPFGKLVTTQPKGTFHIVEEDSIDDESVDPIDDETIDEFFPDHEEEPKKKADFSVQKPDTFGNILQIIRCIAKVFAGAIVLQFMAGIVPELSDRMPNFFLVVNALNKIFDNMCSLLAPILGMF